MAKISKRKKMFLDLVESGKVYAVEEALGLLQKASKCKFVESVDVAVNLGIDTRKSDQTVRGAVVLPHGIGKTVRVAVFASGDKADAAKEAGADIVGMEDLAEEIKKGNINFDVVVASPESMKIVGQLGQILGPKGLMPNPKLGTVSPDVAAAVKNVKAGQVNYRADKGGVVHCTIGKADFAVNNLKDNLNVVMQALKKSKPESSKGVYIKKITLSTTMGPGVSVEVAGF